MVDKAQKGIVASIRRNIVPVTVTFAIVIFLLLLPQSVFYRGLVSILAEWQFIWFGRYFPILTMALPIILLSLLLLLILWLVLRRKRSDDEDQPELSLAEQLALSVTRTRLAMRSFFVLAGLGLLGAVVSLILMARLPDDSGDRQEIAVGALPFAVPREGPARLTGTLDWQKLATIDRNLVLANQRTYFIPIVSRIAERKSTRYFVQVFRPEFVLPANRLPGIVPEKDKLLEDGRIVPTKDGPGNSVTGTLRQDGLPDEIVRLYEKTGLEVHPDHYVLYRKTADLRWPYWVAALEFLLLALGAGILAFFQRRQLRRLLGAETTGPA
ncbi:hypothetical protein SAMN02745824_0656 [Parasphingorhabdus marina DSM 22363]|uniref:Uncharacterized protein n=1 Tax=Parasphingorhabdus marina DSM 22363 TaxID=1123272 RepID=A0A1N6CPH4_9SPHN|nr:hypothetical protein [Parasphingorhabdus marina]SIN60396.1 hypothetical protein SAMN02745824_0656 [Parasphingorhabdus marina DSM 22363]